MENLQETGKGCYRGESFTNICTYTVLFVCLIVPLYSHSFFVLDKTLTNICTYTVLFVCLIVPLYSHSFFVLDKMGEPS